jgi:type IV pilus assembly protein PilQ
MNKHVWLVAACVAIAGGEASAAELNSLSELRVRPTPGGAEVVVQGDRAPTFTVFRLSEPDRLVIDFSTADAAGIRGHHAGAGPVRGVVASQFTDERASVGRVLVSLDEEAQYDVRAEGRKVVVRVEDPQGQRASAPQAPAAAPAEEAPMAAAVRADGVLASHLDERPVRNPAQRITGLSYAKDVLKVTTDGELAKYEILELGDPPRLAVDLYGVKLATRPPKVSSARLSNLRAGTHEDKVRLVLDAKDGLPAYTPRRTATGLELRLGAAPPQVAHKAQPPAPAQAKLAAAEVDEPEVVIDGKRVELSRAENAPLMAAAAPRPVEIKDVSFQDLAGGGRVEIKLSAQTQWKVERPDPRSAVLTLDGAKLPKKLERSLDTSALETPVKTVSTFSVPGGTGRVRVVVAAAEPLEESVVQTAQGLSWRLSARGVKTEEVVVNPKSAGFSTEAETYAAEGAPRQRRYTGKRVSFEFKDIDIHNLLRVIAEVSKKNIVVSDDVKGAVTIRLRNVPWDQALEIILRSKSLGQESIGNNTLRIAPLSALEAEAKQREERKKALQRQADLVVRLLPVNYATAGEMSSRVKEVLTERGSVTVDTRTNVLIVRDVAEGVAKAQSLVRNLDTPTPQVLIESRIVEASTTFTKQLGIQWGGHAQFSPATGNPTGLVFPYTAVARGATSPQGNLGVNNPPDFAINLPAAVGVGSGGAVGLVFGSAGGAVALNLRLSALENQGTVKTISAPKVTTLDNNTARISQGVSIPFSQVSAQGVNTTFVEARLSLEVTPHITQDGSVLMAIKAENNQPDPSNTGANGQPAIQRKEANTQVLVRDGETTVIGGIYVRRGATQESSVPFFGKIPLLGLLFKNVRDTDSRQELLIFITPRIINRTTISQTL